MKFLIDENLPPRLATWLRECGHDAAHVGDIGLLGAPDASIAQAALAANRIIVSRDADFGPGRRARVLRIGLGNAPTTALLAWLTPRLDAAIAHFDAGDRFVDLA